MSGDDQGGTTSFEGSPQHRQDDAEEGDEKETPVTCDDMEIAALMMLGLLDLCRVEGEERDLDALSDEASRLIAYLPEHTAVEAPAVACEAAALARFVLITARRALQGEPTPEFPPPLLAPLEKVMPLEDAPREVDKKGRNRRKRVRRPKKAQKRPGVASKGGARQEELGGEDQEGALGGVNEAQDKSNAEPGVSPHEDEHGAGKSGEERVGERNSIGEKGAAVGEQGGSGENEETEGSEVVVDEECGADERGVGGGNVEAQGLESSSGLGKGEAVQAWPPAKPRCRWLKRLQRHITRWRSQQEDGIVRLWGRDSEQQEKLQETDGGEQISAKADQRVQEEQALSELDRGAEWQEERKRKREQQGPEDGEGEAEEQEEGDEGKGEEEEEEEYVEEEDEEGEEEEWWQQEEDQQRLLEQRKEQHDRLQQDQQQPVARSLMVVPGGLDPFASRGSRWTAFAAEQLQVTPADMQPPKSNSAVPPAAAAVDVSSAEDA